MTAPIRLRDACHSYPAFELGPLDLEVAAGSIHVVLGPNGAGKTTLIELVCGLRVPTSGDVELNGLPLDPDDSSRYRRLGYAPDGEDNVPPELTATELWELCAVLHGRIEGDATSMIERAAQIAERLRFVPPRRPIGEYSHGMRRKCQLVAALLHDPPVIVFDEPTNGLDPVAAHELGLVLAERALDGTATLVASHDLMWTMRFADHLSILNEGTIAAHGAPADIAGGAEAVEAVGEMFDRFVEDERR